MREAELAGPAEHRARVTEKRVSEAALPPPQVEHPAVFSMGGVNTRGRACHVPPSAPPTGPGLRPGGAKHSSVAGREGRPGAPHAPTPRRQLAMMLMLAQSNPQLLALIGTRASLARELERVEQQSRLEQLSEAELHSKNRSRWAAWLHDYRCPLPSPWCPSPPPRRPQRGPGYVADAQWVVGLGWRRTGRPAATWPPGRPSAHVSCAPTTPSTC